MADRKVTALWQGDVAEPDGLCWLPDARTMLVCDRTARRLLAVDVANGDANYIPIDCAPGFVFPTSDGDLMIGAGTDLFRVSTTGDAVRDFRVDTVATNEARSGTVDRFGRLWFGMEDTTGKGVHGGVLRYHDGRMVPVAFDQARPGGVALSADGLTLFQAITSAGRIEAHRVNRAAALSDRRVLIELGDEKPSGLAIDADGAIWVALRNGRRLERYSASGELLDTLELSVDPIDIAFGGDGLTNLFISSPGAVSYFRPEVAGAPVFPVRPPSGASLGLIEDDDH